MFIGREKELVTLKNELSSKERKTAILVYGKRRVGKSTLINEAANVFDGIVINHLCVLSTYEGNLELIYRSVCRALNLPYMRFDSLFSLMDFLRNQPQRILLIIDEYQYLKQAGKLNEVDSIMQAVIDRLPQNVKLILCGSYISVMKELLREPNPLFGRFTLIQHIHDFDYYDAAKFYPKLSVRDKVAFYAVFGGCPYVLENLDYSKTLQENIIDLLLPDTGLIRSHIENIMLNEIRKTFDTRILEVIGNGKKRYSEISDALNSPDTGLLEKQLKILVNMETVQKTEPINRRGDKKKRFYEIVDNLMRFYFCFVFGFTGNIARIGAGQFYRMNIEGEKLRQFISRRLEGLALQYFGRVSGTGEYSELVDYGSYWYDDPVNKKSGEFDCVIRQKGDLYDFYECKYYDREMTLAECRQEESQVRQQDGLEISRIGFICTGGFAFKNEFDYILLDGEAIYRSCT